jgi:hypothetical protein
MPKAHRRRFLGADDESTSGQKGLMLRCSNWVRFVNRNAEPTTNDCISQFITRLNTAKQRQALKHT